MDLCVASGHLPHGCTFCSPTVMTYWIFEAYLPSWWAVSWKLTYHGDRRLLEVVRVMVAWFWKCRRCRLVKKGSLNGLMKFETLRVVRLGPAAANKLGQGTAGDLKAPLAEWTRTEEGEEIAYKRKQQWSESEANGRNRPAGEWRGGGRGEEGGRNAGKRGVSRSGWIHCRRRDFTQDLGRIHGCTQTNPSPAGHLRQLNHRFRRSEHRLVERLQPGVCRRHSR